MHKNARIFIHRNPHLIPCHFRGLTLRLERISRFYPVSKNPDLDKLVEKAQVGDTHAFTGIYDQLVKPVYRYIYYRVESEVAEDLTEDTFLKVWQNLRKYKKGINPFSSWVFRIAHNLVVDYYRKHKVTTEIDEHTADTQLHSDPHGQAELKLTQVRLRKVIRKLPDNYQQIIILKYINDLDNREIAATIGKSEGAVRTLQFRALEKLKGLIGSDYDF